MNYFSVFLILIGVAVLPVQSQDVKSKEPGELKLKLTEFLDKKSHSIAIKLDWGEGKLLTDNTWAARTKGEGSDALGKFTYVATRVANPEWTEYSLWILYASGKYKNQSLRLTWVTHGHEPPDNSQISGGTWIFATRLGRVRGVSE